VDTAGYVPQSEDTSMAAEELMFRAYREMPSWEKAHRISELCRSTSLLALAGIRMRYPGCSDEEALIRLAELRLGAETVRKVIEARSRERVP
jgi:hypothetical protein